MGRPHEPKHRNPAGGVPLKGNKSARSGTRTRTPSRAKVFKTSASAIPPSGPVVPLNDTPLIELVGMGYGRTTVMVSLAVLVSACTSDGAPETTGTTSTTAAPTSTTEAPIVLPDVTPPPGYELVWRDEFLEPELNLSQWRVEHSTFGDGGNTLHCYIPENVQVSDGLLVLRGEEAETTCPNGSVRQFSSGMVSSPDLASFTTGWFEVRARVPEGQGLWPAIWMSPNDSVYGRWPASGEIDLMEVRGQTPNVVRVNAHYLDGSARRAQNPRDIVAAPGSGFADSFHTFGLRWEPGRMVFMIDGLEQHVIEDWTSSVGPGDAPFDQPFFFRLNLAIGGNYPGAPDNSTPWPAEFEIDWVRVFQPIG